MASVNQRLGIMLVVACSLLAGCDDAGPGEQTERNIDEAMEELEERLKEVGEGIEEEADES